MIFKLARKQFNKMTGDQRAELRDRVNVFAASENYVITHFNKNGIMCISDIIEK